MYIRTASSTIATKSPMMKPHALILAGGESRRWNGRDKGLIEWRQLPLVEHVVRRLLPQVSGITISCNRNTEQYQAILERNTHQHSPKSAPAIINDTQLVQRGPLGGIYEFLTTLKQQTNTKTVNTVFICCCDTPLLPGNLVEQLNSHKEQSGCHAVYPKKNDEHYWLNVLIDVDAGQQALTNLIGQSDKQRTFSIKNWLKQLNTQTIEAKNADNFLNINDSTTMERLEQTVIHKQP